MFRSQRRDELKWVVRKKKKRGAPRQEDQVVSAGQLATSDHPRWEKAVTAFGQTCFGHPCLANIK